jgi:hypothetical protein
LGKNSVSKRRIFLVIVSIALWIIVDATVVSVLPVFAAMFADFGSKLPFVTRAILRLADAVKEYGVIYRVTFSGLLVGASVAVVATESRRGAFLFFASGAVAASIIAIALVAPILQLAEIAKELK